MQLKNGEKLIISMAKVSDARDIIRYFAEVLEESDNLSMGASEFRVGIKEEEEFLKKLDLSNNSVMILGRINDELVSITTLIGSSKTRFSHKTNLSISVKKKCWNLGIGRIMMEKTIEFAKENIYIEHIHLEVRKDNDVAIKLYESLGFETFGVYKNAVKIKNEYFDTNLMNLYFK